MEGSVQRRKKVVVFAAIVIIGHLGGPHKLAR